MVEGGVTLYTQDLRSIIRPLFIAVDDDVPS